MYQTIYKRDIFKLNIHYIIIKLLRIVKIVLKYNKVIQLLRPFLQIVLHPFGVREVPDVSESTLPRVREDERKPVRGRRSGSFHLRNNSKAEYLGVAGCRWCPNSISDTAFQGKMHLVILSRQDTDMSVCYCRMHDYRPLILKYELVSQRVCGRVSPRHYHSRDIFSFALDDSFSCSLGQRIKGLGLCHGTVLWIKQRNTLTAA